MAYPMIQWPALAKFRARLTGKFGCQYKTMQATTAEEGEEAEPVSYFERTVDGRVLHHVVSCDRE